MKAKIYLPYYPGAVLANDVNEMSDEEYTSKLMDVYGGGYNDFMNEAMGIMTDSRYSVVDILPEKYMIDSVNDDTKVCYYQFDGLLNDGDDASMSETEFSFYAESGDMCAFFVQVLANEDDGNENDAVLELKSWVVESERIMSDRRIDDEQKIMKLPERDLIVEVSGFNGIPHRYILKGSRVVDNSTYQHFAIIVNRIEEE